MMKNKIINNIKLLTGMAPALQNIYINTTGACTNSCYMCPGRAAKKRNKHMPDDIFDALIEKLAAIDYSCNVHFYGQNEPLTDSKIFQRIKYARTKLPKASLHLISNFTTLTERKMNQLIELPLDRLVNSIYALDEKSYKKICRSNNYNTAISNQVLFIKKWSKEKKYPFLVFLIDSEHNKQDQAFIEWFLKMIPVTKTERSPLFHTREVLPKPKNRNYFGRCLFGNLLVNGEGNASICNFDPDCITYTGNVKEQGIDDLLNGKLAKTIRRSILFSAEPKYKSFCNICDYANENKWLYFLLPNDSLRNSVTNRFNLNNGFNNKLFKKIAVNTAIDIDTKREYFLELFSESTNIPERINMLRDNYYENQL